MRIDAFAHALPVELRRAVFGHVMPTADLINWEALDPLYDISRRLELMDATAIDVQVLTTPSPPLESLFEPPLALKLAELANDSMAKLVAEYPHRFRGVATIPLIDPSWAVEELQRAVLELGLAGPLVYSHINGWPLDQAELEPYWDAVESLRVPIWLHPDRPRTAPDYVSETESRYGLFLVLGWPYETSVAMMRLVLSGVMARHPDLSIIVHHGGGMIPFFARRIEMNFAKGGQARVPVLADDMVDVSRDLRRFYVDTVLQGSLPALQTAIQFFGIEHMLFASDAPFGPNQGRDFTESSIESVERLPLDQREAIFHTNAAALLGV